LKPDQFERLQNPMVSTTLVGRERGLATARGVVKRAGGMLRVSTGRDQATRVDLEFPAADNASDLPSHLFVDSTVRE
jgi:nitrogen-specific signal transduction histidine kinase